MFRNIWCVRLVSIGKEKSTMNRGDSMAFVFVLLLGLVLILAVAYLKHRKQAMLHEERMAALEKGTAIPLGPEPAPWSPRAYLLRGLIWSFSGVALIVCLLGIAWSTQRPYAAVYTAYRAKTVSKSFDIPLDQARQIVDEEQAARGMPAGVAVLGVVPLAVGLAYLVFYFTDDSRKRLAAGAPSESFTPRI
jgi:cbb3-type cytochrome oxidase subunit 3